MANGRCITAQLEIMPSVLALQCEYKKMHPQANDKDAYGAAYTAFKEEMTRQTMDLKQRYCGIRYYEGGTI